MPNSATNCFLGCEWRECQTSLRTIMGEAMFVALNGANGANGAIGANGANQNVAGLIMLGEGIPRPIGVSPWPFVDRNGKLQRRAQISIDADEIQLKIAQYADPLKRDHAPDVGKFTGWTIENRAVAAIAEIAALAPHNWRELCDPTGWLTDAIQHRVPRELSMLRQLVPYRDGVMSEAIAQATGIIPYFQGLAGFTAASHPETTNLCIIALKISVSSWSCTIRINTIVRGRPNYCRLSYRRWRYLAMPRILAVIPLSCI